jgi:hypothetical protein
MQVDYLLLLMVRLGDGYYMVHLNGYDEDLSFFINFLTFT